MLDILSLFSTLAIFFGVTLFIFGIVVLIIQLLILFFIYKFVKTNPGIALFLLIIVIAVSIAGSLNPVTFIPAVIGLVSALIVLVKEYKRFKFALKIR